MKRTDLIELADAVESQAEDWKDDTDARALARFARFARRIAAGRVAI